MIVFLCSCGARLRAADGSAGKKARCPSCRKLAVVPAAASGFLENDPDDETETRPLPIVPAPEDDEDTRPLPSAR